MVASPAPAAPPKVVVEITPKAARRMDAELARRLIQIELGDIEVPARHDDKYQGAARTVFFRVLAPSAERLHVELWDRGHFYGARGVSVTGSAQLRSRRIALGAAELARRLRNRRIADGRRAQAEELAAAQDAERERREKRLSGVTVEPALRGAWISGLGVVGGPGVQVGFRPNGRTRFAVGAGAYAGVASELADSPGVRWLEAGLRLAQGFRLGPGTELAVGAEAAAAVLRINDVPAVDGTSGQSDTWSARGGALLRLEQRLSSSAFLAAGPDVGVVLRPIPVADSDGRKKELGGLWLGLSVELALTP